MFATWREFYQSDLQSVYAPWLVPEFFIALLVALATISQRRHGAARDALPERLAPAFVIETVLDPYVTGPLLRWLPVEKLRHFEVRHYVGALVRYAALYYFTFFSPSYAVIHPQSRALRRLS